MIIPVGCSGESGDHYFIKNKVLKEKEILNKKTAQVMRRFISLSRLSSRIHSIA
jgi:hypothetical protein